MGRVIRPERRHAMAAADEITRQEWEVILELLKAEREELPVEIHHTDNREVLAHLKNRQALVDGLIEKVQGRLGGETV
jgi:uncharacterized alpha-E superfamily protein